MTLRQRSSSMLTKSLSRVMPALCTTMSRPPCRDVACSTIRRAGVLGRDVELEGRALHLVGHRGQRVPGCGHVDGDDGRAVAGEHPGDLGTDAARGPGDDRDLAREGTERSRRSPLVDSSTRTTWPST